MGLYDINFPDFSNKLNVPKLRQSKFTAFMNILMSQLTWNHTRYFTDYIGGASYSDYNNASTYSFGDIVLYRDTLNDKKIYLCIVDTSTGVAPTNTTNWLKLMDDFIGADERLAFTNQKLCMEWILNRYFGTTFNQPPVTSDIYITNSGTSDRFPKRTSSPALYSSSTSYAVGAFVQYSFFYYVCIQATTGNAPPAAGGDNAYWAEVEDVWYYEATRTYSLGDVIQYANAFYVYINATSTSGNAPPNATYWTGLTNISYTAGYPNQDHSGFNINIPASVYSNLGGTTTLHPNRADETIYKIVRRYWDACQFRIITY